MNAYNLYAYCSNNPVMYVDPSGCVIGALIFGAATIVTLLFIPSSEDKRTERKKIASQKYNEETVNINGNNPNGNINVTINDDSIVVENSYVITDYYEQLEILEVCVNSEHYTGTYRDLKEMQIEWRGHNLTYILTEPKVLRAIIESFPRFVDAHDRSKSVDIKGYDDLQPFYEVATLGGLIGW